MREYISCIYNAHNEFIKLVEDEENNAVIYIKKLLAESMQADINSVMTMQQILQYFEVEGDVESNYPWKNLIDISNVPLENIQYLRSKRGNLTNYSKFQITSEHS